MLLSSVIFGDFEKKHENYHIILFKNKQNKNSPFPLNTEFKIKPL